MPDMPNPPFLVPFPENPGFLGRTTDLDRLHAALQQHADHGEAVGITPAGVTGMGGIGKTQLAVKYVYTYRDHYPDGIYWLNGANSLYEEFADLGRKLQGRQSDLLQRQRLLAWLDEYFNENDLRHLCFKLDVNFEDLPPGGRLDKARELVAHMERRDQLDALEKFIQLERPSLAADKAEVRRDPALDELVGTAFGWLKERPQALLVLDNLEQPERLQEPIIWDWVPARLACSLLFTTRQRHLRQAQAIKLKVLPAKVAMQLLLRYRPEVLRTDHPEHKIAQAICHMMGYLPLALEIAGAQLEKLSDISLADYRAELEASGLLSILTDERTPVTVRHETGLKAVLASQWQRLAHEEMRQLLKVAGQIPEAAQIPGPRLGLLAGVPQKGPSIFDVTLTRALTTLVDASLVEQLEGDLVRLHPLVRDFARQQVAEAEQATFRQQCVQNLVTVFEDVALLEEQCRQRGIDALQEDLLTALDWLEPPQAISSEVLNIPPWRQTRQQRQAANDDEALPRRLKNLLRLVQQEIHTLRGWQPTQQPTFFGQQIVYRLQTLGLKELFDGGIAYLRRQHQPYWQARWRKKQESLAQERTLIGHSSWVMAVAVTPDGQRAISASGDQTLKVWDLSSGKEERTLTGHGTWVRAVAVTPDGRRAISASGDQTLKVWDLQTGTEERTLTGHGSGVNTVAVTPDGQWAISAADDKTLKVWDLQTGAEERTLTGHGRWVRAVAVTPDGRRVVSASGDQTLKVWDLRTGAEERTLTGHGSGVNAVAVTPDGQRAISASDDGTLKVWNLSSGEEEQALTGHGSWVMAVGVTPDGRRAISASGDQTLKVWDLDQTSFGLEERALAGHGRSVNAVAVTPDGQWTISASADQTLKVWDLRTGTEERTLTGHGRSVNAVAVTPDGQRAISASADQTLKVWDLRTGAEERTLTGHGSWVRAVAVTPDGRWAISASDDQTLKVWDLRSGEEKRTLTGHGSWVMAVAVTPDGQRAISASTDGTLKVWDLSSGEEEQTLTGHGSGVMTVAVTPDGHRVISASDDGTLKVWDLSSGEEKRTLTVHGSEVIVVTVTPDGQRAISAADNKTLKVWDLRSGEEIVSISLDGALLCIVVAGDGATVVTGDSAGSVYCLRYEEPDTAADEKRISG